MNMNPELMTVLRMRQKEMEYLRLSPAPVESTLLVPPFTPSYGSAALVTPSALLQSPLRQTYFDKTACYSPLSVGQLPPTSVSYDMFGGVWQWIADVAAHFALQRQTAHCAVQYAHKILRQHAMTQTQWYEVTDPIGQHKRLQVVGLVCVFLAAKIEEVHPPKAAAFASFASDHGLTCAADELVRLEAEVLEELKWNLHPPTVLSWLLFLLAGEPADQQLETMADFVDASHPSIRKDVFVAAISVIDAALLDSQALEYLPSVLAGSAILLADPGLDLFFVAQFLQLDPSLLWECKNWLVLSGSGAGGLECDGSRDDGRWDKVPTEELLFIQTRVALPGHMAYGAGLLPSDRAVFEYAATPVESFSQCASYLPAECPSPLDYDLCGPSSYCRRTFEDDVMAPAPTLF